jgi:inorganic pyrophosphatase
LHVVTSGWPFLDIDAYASMVALAELLRTQGEDAIAASGTHRNASVPPTLRKWEVQFETNYQPNPDDTFTLVDISEPEYFDKMVDLDRVAQVIDHHLGFEKYWRTKGISEVRIEFVGAAATLVYEQWQQAGLLDKLDQNSARLLACGILDNTLNLRAKITTDRDKAAYADLAKRGRLPKDWPSWYFSECQAYILSDVAEAITDDAKTIRYPSLPYNVYAGQLALWDAKAFIHSSKEGIRRTLSTPGLPWYMNLIDIHSGRTILLCEDDHLRLWLTEILDVTFEDSMASTDRMWLRKEIMKRAIEKDAANVPK